MAFQNYVYSDDEWDMWAKMVHNQVQQGSSIGQGALMKEPANNDSIYDLMRKFLDNQILQG